MARGLVALLLVTLSLGCVTYRSTFLNRQEDGTLMADSHCGTPGVPVAVKVPTHLDVWIEERYYLLPHDQIFREVAIMGADGLPVVSRDVRAELVETKKIFLVDFKRAAAGVSQSGLKFTDEQGIKEVSGKIQDETLRDATAAFNAISPWLQARKMAAGTTTALESKGLVSGARVVAYRRFDLNAMDFEEAVAEFVACHLNESPCGPAGGSLATIAAMPNSPTVQPWISSESP